LLNILDLLLYYLAKSKKTLLEIEEIIEKYDREKEISNMSIKKFEIKLNIKKDIYKFQNR